MEQHHRDWAGPAPALLGASEPADPAAAPAASAPGEAPAPSAGLPSPPSALPAPDPAEEGAPPPDGYDPAEYRWVPVRRKRYR
ncbi:MAG: hypothetical protein QOG84_59 [Sphingomonadales bacterium]|jgi:hypothetical protein|nr:hypothetical protein [Sphingomonadales bacterium]